MTSKTEPKPKENFSIRWDAELLAEVKVCAEAIGKNPSQFVQDAIRDYVAKEKPKFEKMAELRNKLFLTKP